MARTHTLVQLNEALLAALDQRAAHRGVSRSQVIREAVEAHLAEDHDAEISRQIVAGYERVPQANPDEWLRQPSVKSSGEYSLGSTSTSQLPELSRMTASMP